MKKISMIMSKNSISFILNDEGTYRNIQVNKADSKYNDLLPLIKAKDEEGIINLLIGKRIKFELFIKGNFEVTKDTNQIYHRETETLIGPYLSKTILEWSELGFPVEPLVNFHLKVMKNPNPDSVEDLYRFLEANSFAITDEGNFIGYKRVTRKEDGNLYDSHTRTILNNVGETVTMPREKCNSNRNESCSSGLHVGAFAYVNGFTGNVTVLCEVSPENVVSVPLDYNSQKMRCCEYKVLSIYEEKQEMDTKYYSTHEDYDEIEEDIDLDTMTHISKYQVPTPAYESMTGKEWADWAMKNYNFDVAIKTDKKDRVYKKIINYIDNL